MSTIRTQRSRLIAGIGLDPADGKQINWIFGKQGALFHAVAENDIPLARELIREGADITRTSPQGYTVLHRAAAAGNLDMVEFLLDQGAKPGVTAKDGQTPKKLAHQQGHAKLAQRLARACTTTL